MSGKRAPERPSIDLRLHFFSPPFVTNSHPIEPQAISAKLAEVSNSKARKIRSFAECDCACK
jgi:hypothetical protein